MDTSDDYLNALAMIQWQEEQQQASSSHQGALVPFNGNVLQTPQGQLIPHQEGSQQLQPHQEEGVDHMGDDPFMGQEIGVTGGQWGFREFQRIRYITPLGVPVEQVRILQYNHNGDQHLLGQQVEEVTKALDAVVNFSKEYAHEVNGAIGEIRVALSTLRIEIQAHAEGVLNEGRGLQKIVDHNHQQIDEQFRSLQQDLMGFNTSLKPLHGRIDEIASNVDNQMGTINSRLIQVEQKLENFMAQTNAVQESHEETIRKLEQELQQERDKRKRDLEQERQHRRQERVELEAHVIGKLRMKDALIDSLVSRMEQIEKLQSTYCNIQSNKDPEGVGPLATLTAEFSAYMKKNVELEAKIESLRFKHDALSNSTQDVQQSLNALSTTVQTSGHAMSLRVEKIRVGYVEMKKKLDGVDFKLGNSTKGINENTSPFVEPAVPLVVQDLQLQVRTIREEGEELGKRISGMQLSIDAKRKATTRISKHESPSAGTPRLPSHHSPRQGDKGHWEKTHGAFWSRVTPPELLYIWLLSFDELRLAMNAHLPVVRPLLCYARRGATPMHQKIGRRH